MPFARKPPLLLTLGTAFLLTGGGLIAYWGLTLRDTLGRGLPAGIKAVPDTALFAASVSTSEEDWLRLRRFGTSDTQAAFDRQLATWRDRWLTDYGLSYAEDIGPWVGSAITVAVLPDEEPGTPPDPLLPRPTSRIALLPIADLEAAQAAATRLDALSTPPEDAETPEAETQTFRGITLTRLAAESGGLADELWVGVLGTELLLVAESQRSAEAAINAYKGGKSLVDVVGYRRAFEAIAKPQAFAQVYLDVPATSQYIAQSSQPPLPTTVLDAFQASRGVVTIVDITTRGIQATSISWLQSGSDRTYTVSNVPPQMPQYLPRETLMMASGGNFQQVWQDLSQRRTWGGLTAFNPENLALSLQASTGLTLEADLLPWMAGEFALALVPPAAAAEETETEPSSDLPNPGLVALVKASDRDRAAQTFAQLDDVVRSRYRFTLQPETLDAITLTRWVSPFESTTITRGWLPNDVALLTIGQGTEAAIAPSPQRPLATHPLFQLMVADAPAVNNGTFYLNLAALSQTENNLFVPALPTDTQGALSAIEGLGVTATVLDERRLRYDLYVALTVGNRPGPLPATVPENEPPAPPATE